MAIQVSILSKEENRQYSSSVVKSAMMDFDGRGVSIFSINTDWYINP